MHQFEHKILVFVTRKSGMVGYFLQDQLDPCLIFSLNFFSLLKCIDLLHVYNLITLYPKLQMETQ